MEKKCVICGKEFIVTSDRSKKVWCSPECQKKYNFDFFPVLGVKTCPVCNKKFKYTRMNKTQKYCSQECSSSIYKKKEQTEIRICPNCNKEFLWSSKYPNKKYCSDECCSQFNNSKYMKNKTTKIDYGVKDCPICGKTFILKASNQKYCSTKCTVKANTPPPRKEIKEIRKCLYCGKEFEWSSKHANKKYCSRDCGYQDILRRHRLKKDSDEETEKLKAMVYVKVNELLSFIQKGDATFNNQYLDYRNLSDIPESVKEKVLERDNHCCYICGKKTNLHIHHKIKRSNGGSHEMDNLITLCGSCHRHIEIADFDNALKKCTKNAIKNYYPNKYATENSDEMFEKAQKNLYLLFDQMQRLYPNDKDIQILITNALDELESIANE